MVSGEWYKIPTQNYYIKEEKTMKKIYDKDVSEQGLLWTKHQEAKFDKTPISEIDKWEYRHVQKLSKDFIRSLRFHASL